MKKVLLKDDVEAAVLGGSVYACGGGGWARHGLELGNLAVTIGRPTLVSIDELEPDDIVATVAAIGAPGDLSDWEMLGVDYIRAFELLQKEINKPIKALMIGQNGMSSTLNAWLPSSIKSCFVLDALGDLRAHPTADMGSLGLDKEVTIQSAAGGNRAKGQYLETVVKGNCDNISWILRTSSDRAGGFIASCRNPIKASFVRDNAVLGGISMAINLGKEILSFSGNVLDKIELIAKYTKGFIAFQGKVLKNTLKYTSEAFDIGQIIVESKNTKAILHVLNEYMALDIEGKRISTYPSIITTFDKFGQVISAGHIKAGQEIYILCVDKNNIPLSASVNNKDIYIPVQKALGIDLISYLPQKTNSKKTTNKKASK